MRALDDGGNVYGALADTLASDWRRLARPSQRMPDGAWIPVADPCWPRIRQNQDRSRDREAAKVGGL